MIRTNVNKYRNNNIPLEGVWLDIKYMENYVDFSYDKVAFKGLPGYVDTLHNLGIKVIPIIDAGISSDYDHSSDPNAE